ncbi:MAG: DUF881 domain-containing protein [Bacillota bacterium]|nr:DUF881 domain-containing protein [Bacillota bacterium]
MPKGEKRFIFFIIFLFLGILVSLQFRGILTANKQKTLTAINIDKLETQLEDEKKTGESLKKQISEAQKLNDQYLKDSVDNMSNSQIKKLKSELDAVKLKMGLTDVKGPGLIIKLDDGQETPDSDVTQLIIHDGEILQVLNELKAGGAQAISINGERIVSTSEQICAGPTIRINKRRYPVPYEITAIGNPQLLYDTLDKSSIAQDFRDFGIKMDMVKSQNIMIPKFIGNLDDLVTSMEVAGK